MVGRGAEEGQMRTDFATDDAGKIRHYDLIFQQLELSIGALNCRNEIQKGITEKYEKIKKYELEGYTPSSITSFVMTFCSEYRQTLMLLPPFLISRLFFLCICRLYSGFLTKIL